MATRLAAWAAVALMAATVAVVRVAAESPVGLTIRLYNAAGISADELLSARREAGPILRDTGMDVTFRLCGRIEAPGDPGDPCDDSLKPSEVVVRIIDAPLFSTTLHPDAYGVTYIVEETNRGWLATVFADRIASAAARVGVDRGTLLGRVLAHEVGHLLLGHGYHGDAGVMRAEWPDQILNRRDAEGWRFSMLEAAAMQRLLASIAH